MEQKGDALDMTETTQGLTEEQKTDINSFLATEAADLKLEEKRLNMARRVFKFQED